MKNYRFLTGLFMATFVFLSLNLSAQTQSLEGKPLLILQNGQPANLAVGITPEEMKGGITLKSVEGLEILSIYHVRGSRPVRAKNIQDQNEVEGLSLSHWLAGKEGTSPNLSEKVDVRAGDRIAFRALYKGEEVSFSCPVI